VNGLPASPYLDEAEAAEYLRISQRTLARRRHEGRGPRYRKHGVKVLYTVADLNAWSDGLARAERVA
jgi:hypothetical protein